MREQLSEEALQDLAALLEIIDEQIALEPMRPKGFGITVSEYQRARRVGRLIAEDALQQLADAGTFECKKMRYSSGRGGLVYYKAGTWPPKD